MLDKNTDRMWYVIGAIIIGGLILTSSIVLFTDVAFVSASDSYMILHEKAERVMYNLSPKVGVKHWVEDYINDFENWHQGGIKNNGADSGNNYALVTGYVEIEPGEYSIDFVVDGLDENIEPSFAYAVYTLDEPDQDGNHEITQRSEKYQSGERFAIDEPSYFRVRIAYKLDGGHIRDELYPEEIVKWSFSVNNYVHKGDGD